MTRTELTISTAQTDVDSAWVAYYAAREALDVYITEESICADRAKYESDVTAWNTANARVVLACNAYDSITVAH